jgi:hypothetical protein
MRWRSTTDFNSSGHRASTGGPSGQRIQRRRLLWGRLLGIHLEVPFLSAQEGARGAHNPEWMQAPDVDYLEQLIVWAGLGNDDLSATIIADGHHLPASLLKTIVRPKGPERRILVSDASPLAGLSPGEYESVGAKVVLDGEGRLHSPATGYMVGSSATLAAYASHLASLNIVSSGKSAGGDIPRTAGIRHRVSCVWYGAFRTTHGAARKTGLAGRTCLRGPGVIGRPQPWACLT